MRLLQNNKLVFIQGGGNKRKPNTAGYGYMIKLNNKELIIERPSKSKTTIYACEIKALVEIFENLEETNDPLLIFLSSSYTYDRMIGKEEKVDYKDEWATLDELITTFEEAGGSYRLYNIKPGLKPTKKNARKAVEHFHKENLPGDIAYLKQNTQTSINKVFKEILRSCQTLRSVAASARKRCKA